jgi:hypothetical protein
MTYLLQVRGKPLAFRDPCYVGPKADGNFLSAGNLTVLARKKLEFKES